MPSRNLKAVGVTPKELEMGNRLVEGVSGKWNPKEFRDTYLEDLMVLINKRIKAGETETIDETEPKVRQPAGDNVVDLMALLKQSVEGKRLRHRPTGARKAIGGCVTRGGKRPKLSLLTEGGRIMAGQKKSHRGSPREIPAVERSVQPAISLLILYSSRAIAA